VKRAIAPWVILFVLLTAVMNGSILFPNVFGRNALNRKNSAAADALFTNGVLHILKIEIPKQGVRSLRQDPRKYVTATLREGPLVLTNVMVRLKGGAGSFRDLEDKPGLTLDLGNANGVFHGLKKFHLNNSVQDDTYLSEWMCSELFRQAGVPAGRVAHAVVELNNRRLGLYVLLESINSDFLARAFEQPHGNVYSLSANADVDGPLERMGGREDTSGSELRTLAAAAGERDLARLQTRLPGVLDLPRFLSFMALEVMLDHWDGYTFNVKNYEVYHDPRSQKMVFMPHDLDQVLRDENAPIMPPGAHGMVARAVLRQPTFRKLYRERFDEVFRTLFVPTVLLRRIDERVAKLAPQLRKYDPELAQGFIEQPADLKARVVRRARALASQVPARSRAAVGGCALPGTLVLLEFRLIFLFCFPLRLQNRGRRFAFW
jgi:spore coat protein H